MKMKIFKTLGLLTRLVKKSKIPDTLIGQLKVRAGGATKVRIEFRGHQVSLLEERECSFDLFKSGGDLRITVDREKRRVEVPETRKEVEVKGVLLTLEVIPIKKKIGLEDFHLLKLIGKGTYGKVVLVRHNRSMRLYACKIIRKETAAVNLTYLLNEKNILTQINSPFVIHLLASFQTANKVFLILPYIEGGELFIQLQKCNTFSEERARIYMCELILAVEYLHRNGIIYRDIKPENILLDRRGHVVLCDFGLSKVGESANTYCGTPEYIAPEIIRNESYNESVDYYTLGVLLYEMVVGCSPFICDDNEDLENKILFDEIEYPEGLSEEVVDLIGRLMHRNARMRLGGERLRRHAFFGGIDWERVERREYVPEYVPEIEAEREEGYDGGDSVDSVVYSDTFQKQFSGFTYYGDYL